jgi:hypothetical protein
MSEPIRIRVKATCEIWHKDGIVPAGTPGTIESLDPLTVTFDTAVRPGGTIAGFRVEVASKFYLSPVTVEPVPTPWVPNVGDFVRLKCSGSIRLVVRIYRASGGYVECHCPADWGPLDWRVSQLEPWRPEVRETVRVKATGREHEVAESPFGDPGVVCVRAQRGLLWLALDAVEPVNVPGHTPTPAPKPATTTIKVPAIGQRVRRNHDDKEGLVYLASADFHKDITDNRTHVHIRFDDGTTDVQPPSRLTPIGPDPKFTTIEVPA